ncbi:FUSC family protein [Curtobacterium sp. MCSS17_005]|uniref:FUSC family protein n=1 Tax=Curtobacterium sp. MCSS17_005 TaxID=2175641 RepID=UPI000DA89F1F|nr:FUSC family protein [Curtobacterium sp. MCSS17_005]WIB34400.1 FUSC family protein [Curtobacterium sp. MCSS17_005]
MRVPDRFLPTITRLRATGPTILQLALTVTLAFSIAHYGLGHTSPALACTVALSSLSLNRDARPRRVAETAIAMVLGITLSATVVTTLGRGPAQVAGTIIVVLTVATLLSRNPAFALSAGTQSMLVAVLPDPVGGPYMRAVDGAVGGLCALFITAVLPSAPMRRALLAGDSVIKEVADCTHLIARALADGDPGPARTALERLRANGARIEAWGVTLESARAVAAFSPLSRRGRNAWVMRVAIHRGLARATTDLRMVARRAAVLSATGRPQLRTAAVISDIAEGFDLLALGHSDPEQDVSAEPFSLAAQRIGELDGRPSIDQGMLAMLRQVVVDGLVAIGHSDETARGVLPVAEVPPATTTIDLPGAASVLGVRRRVTGWTEWEAHGSSLP